MKATCRKKTRILATACALSLLASASAQADYSSTIKSSSPAGYWRFSESNFISVPNSATNIGTLGKSGYGTYLNNPTHNVAGALAGETNAAASFAGDGGCVQVPYDATTMGVSTFSIEAWIKPAVAPPPSSQSSLAAVLSCAHMSSPRTGWLIYQSTDGWNLRGYNGVDASSTIDITGGPAPVAGTWYHVVATFDGSIARVYVNGAKSKESSTITTFAPNTDGVLSIGSRSDIAFSYTGSVDEVAYYAKVLTDSEIAAHYAAGTNSTTTSYASVISSSSPAVYLRLDEPAYTLPSTANAGTLGSAADGGFVYYSGTTQDFDSPAFPGLESTNRVFAPSGTNGIVKIPALNLNTNTITMEVWFKPNGTQSSYAGVFFHRGGSSSATGIMYRDVSGEIGYHWKDTQYSWSSGLSPADGVWNYAALAVTPTNATMYLWNGSTWQSSVNTTTHDIEAFDGYTRVGADQDGTRYFVGEIDEPAIYSRTLGEGELRTHVLSAIGGQDAPAFVSDTPVVSPDEVQYNTRPFTLSIDAYGVPPLVYTWRKDGTTVYVATNSSTFTKTATLSDSGSYDVVISDANGSITSQTVTITISDIIPPQIDMQPVSRSVYAGGTAKFSVGASGTPVMYYQWTQAGTNLVGATNSTLTITNADTTVAGTYNVIISNTVGTVTSDNVTLTLRTPAAGSYEATVVSLNPIAYWRMNETDGTNAYDYVNSYDGNHIDVMSLASVGPRPPSLPGFESSNTAVTYDTGIGYTTTGLSLLNNRKAITVCGWVNLNGDFGQYGLFGQNDVWEFRFLKNKTQIELWSPYGSIDYTFGSRIQSGTWFFIAAVGDATTMSLYINGQQVATTTSSASSSYGTSTAPFIFTGDTSGNGDSPLPGSLDEIAVFDHALTSTDIATIYSKAAYSSNTKPTFSQQPFGSTVAQAHPASFTVTAYGSMPITYQWYKDGTAIADATNTSLTFTSANISDSGSYYVIASNTAGSAKSSTVTLTVNATPTYANLTNGLVLHMPFDGDTKDTSGLKNDGTINGSVPFVTGELGQGIDLESTKDSSIYNSVSVNDSASYLSFDENASFTVAFWLKYSGSFNDTPIIGNAQNSTWQLGWVLTDSATSGKLEWSLVSATGTYVRDPVPNCPTINDEKWHHVACVIDRTSKMTFVYVDDALTGSWKIDDLGTLVTGYGITIGQDPNLSYGSASFMMDDLGIWNYALSYYQVTSIFNAAKNNLSFDVKGQDVTTVTLTIKETTDGQVILSWPSGTLQSADEITGPWTAVSGATAPSYTVKPTDTKKFYQVK